MEYLQTVLIILLGILIVTTRKKSAPATNTASIVVDTCGAIDGRIVELAAAGFIPRRILVPQFVVAELQQLADGHDSQKRERARFGLDVIKLLQDNPALTVTVDAATVPGDAVDDKLVALAKKRSAFLYTTDFNLNKVAGIAGVQVLNVNEMAQMLRPTALPGERLDVRIVQKGSGPGQGVGYLDDGTMVVVDKAAGKISKVMQVEITRTLQTAAGKMLFATQVFEKSHANRR